MFIKAKGVLINCDNIVTIRRINDCVVIYFNDGMHHDIECKSKSEAKRVMHQIAEQIEALFGLV